MIEGLAIKKITFVDDGEFPSDPSPSLQGWFILISTTWVAQDHPTFIGVVIGDPIPTTTFSSPEDGADPSSPTL
jgi:hypothetical protein